MINYIEANSVEKNHIVDGILVIGKRDEETKNFIDTFQKYLNRLINITMYDDILENASQILVALTNSENTEKSESDSQSSPESSTNEKIDFSKSNDESKKWY